VERVVLNALAELRLCRLITCAVGDKPSSSEKPIHLETICYNVVSLTTSS
jgi:hypothetical protein